MTVRFDHMIVVTQDRDTSSAFFRWLFDLPEAPSWGPFLNVQLDDGTLLQFAEPPISEVQSQHYGFLVDDDSFDAARTRLDERGIEYYADPQRTEPGQINHDHGGRGMYFRDPSGHFFEILTKSYL